MKTRHRSAFTLLELTVTLAVLSVLSLLTAPLVQNALMRSRIAAVKNNLRVVRDGLECFAADAGKYPIGSTAPTQSLWSDFDSCVALKSLVGTYISNDPTILEDDFSRETMVEIKKSVAIDLHSIPNAVGYTYLDYTHFHVPPWKPLRAFALVSVGPDARDSGLGIAYRTPQLLPRATYDPSNGLRSSGDIGVTNAPIKQI